MYSFISLLNSTSVAKPECTVGSRPAISEENRQHSACQTDSLSTVCPKSVDPLRVFLEPAHQSPGIPNAIPVSMCFPNFFVTRYVMRSFSGDFILGFPDFCNT
ncbi:hypothetical protein FBUS_06717 [Fasciolopsis buskii]|uniref:Uncharacterized protein n=1 Tax=Fasciolopsis buskii TaxID=27845 RepID=A0A8E0RKT2_9TREM|nr:hypothetical protein FBUS_06717 [Fasciolopsis buski]